MNRFEVILVALAAACLAISCGQDCGTVQNPDGSTQYYVCDSANSGAYYVQEARPTPTVTPINDGVMTPIP